MAGSGLTTRDRRYQRPTLAAAIPCASTKVRASGILFGISAARTSCRGQCFIKYQPSTERTSALEARPRGASRRHHRPQASVVAPLCFQLGECAAVLVEHDGGGRIEEELPTSQHAMEHLEVAASARRRTDVERRIEPSDPVEQRAAECHVGAGAESPAPRMVPPVLGRPDEVPSVSQRRTNRARTRRAARTAPALAFRSRREDEPREGTEVRLLRKARTIARAHPSSTTASSSVNAMTSDGFRRSLGCGRGRVRDAVRGCTRTRRTSATRRADASVEGALSTTARGRRTGPSAAPRGIGRAERDDHACTQRRSSTGLAPPTWIARRRSPAASRRPTRCRAGVRRPGVRAVSKRARRRAARLGGDRIGDDSAGTTITVDRHPHGSDRLATQPDQDKGEGVALEALDRPDREPEVDRHHFGREESELAVRRSRPRPSGHGVAEAREEPMSSRTCADLTSAGRR